MSIQCVPRNPDSFIKVPEIYLISDLPKIVDYVLNELFSEDSIYSFNNIESFLADYYDNDWFSVHNYIKHIIHNPNKKLLKVAYVLLSLYDYDDFRYINDDYMNLSKWRKFIDSCKCIKNKEHVTYEEKLWNFILNTIFTIGVYTRDMSLYSSGVGHCSEFLDRYTDNDTYFRFSYNLTARYHKHLFYSRYDIKNIKQMPFLKVWSKQYGKHPEKKYEFYIGFNDEDNEPILFSYYRLVYKDNKAQKELIQFLDLMQCREKVKALYDECKNDIRYLNDENVNYFEKLIEQIHLKYRVVIPEKFLIDGLSDDCRLYTIAHYLFNNS